MSIFFCVSQNNLISGTYVDSVDEDVFALCSNAIFIFSTSVKLIKINFLSINITTILRKLLTRIKNNQLVKMSNALRNTSRFSGKIFGLQSGKICIGVSTLNCCFAFKI